MPASIIPVRTEPPVSLMEIFTSAYALNSIPGTIVKHVSRLYL